MALLLAEIWIWGVLGGIGCIWALCYDNDGLAMLVSVAALVGFFYFADTPVFQWLKDNSPFPLLLYVLGYFAVGTLWMFGKWYFWLLDKRDSLQTFEIWCESQTKKGLWSSYIKDDLDDQVKMRYYKEEYLRKNIPAMSDSQVRTRLIEYIAYWPASMLHSLFVDFFRRVADRIFEVVKRQLQRISDHVFRNFQ